jgi:hypothetical protein
MPRTTIYYTQIPNFGEAAGAGQRMLQEFLEHDHVAISLLDSTENSYAEFIHSKNR